LSNRQKINGDNRRYRTDEYQHYYMQMSTAKDDDDEGENGGGIDGPLSASSGSSSVASLLKSASVSVAMTDSLSDVDTHEAHLHTDPMLEPIEPNRQSQAPSSQEQRVLLIPSSRPGREYNNKTVVIGSILFWVMLIIVAVITAVILYMKVDSKDFPVLNELMGSDDVPVNSPIKTTELNTTDLVPLS